MKKTLSVILAVTMLLFVMAACGTSDNTSGNPSSTPSTNTSTGNSSVPGGDPSEGGDLPDTFTYNSVNLGDYADLKADLKFITHRTDLQEDGTLDSYVKKFQEKYPNITVAYEGITDYQGDMATRMSTANWGDINMIPPAILKKDLGQYYLPLGTVSELEGRLNFVTDKAFGGTVYGLSSTNNANGVLYNKKVFSDAGITTLPRTPEEFQAALQKIKDNTDAIPLYTNFAAGWTMGGAWNAYLGGSSNGDPDFINNMPKSHDVFAKTDDYGPYALFKVLYDAVVNKLTEEDPSTTDWESSKSRLNNGEIATMVLGSWAVVQMQEAGPNPDDIGYMPFPISVNGTQYASAGPDYEYGININSSKENQLAALLYIKWLVEESNFDYDQGGVPTVKDHKMPDTLSGFAGVELVAQNPAPEGEEDLFQNVNEDSELGVNTADKEVIRVVEAAITGSESYDDIIADWNARWNASVDKFAK
ncbi:sugar ABC transporter substrate-binding protein [Clostridia bacterium]|nr:sugar ABC transporter substrate-binding protein [Clostridia bacterium]